MAASPDGDESSGLDRILKNTEFENSQQAKAIETEKERIQAYQKELEVKQRQTKELEESTLNLDEQAKRLHKQFKLNRENYESLKRTSTVLDEHEEALQRKLKTTLHDGKQQRTEQQEALAKYEGVWATYQTKYEGFLKARELSKRNEELKHVKEHSVGLERQIKEMESSLVALHLESGNDDTLMYVLQIASLRVDTENNMNMAKSNLQATDCLQQEIVELEGRIAKAAESLKQEAIQQKAKETVADLTPIETQRNNYVNPTHPSTSTHPELSSSTSKLPRHHSYPQQPVHRPQSQMIPQPVPSPIQTSANNSFLLPQMPSRPSTSTQSSPGDAIAHSTPINSPSTRQPAAGMLKTPVARPSNTASTSRYMLAIPQLSIPTRSTSTTSQTSTPRRSQPSANSQIKIPSLQTPSRPSHTDQSKQQPPTSGLIQPPPRPSQQPPRPIQPPPRPIQPPPRPIQPPPRPIQPPPRPIQPPPRPIQPPPRPIQQPPRPIQQPPRPIQLPTRPIQLPTRPIQQPSRPSPCVTMPTIPNVQPLNHSKSNTQPVGGSYTSTDNQPKDARQEGIGISDVMIEQESARLNASEQPARQPQDDLPPNISETAAQPHDLLPGSNETTQEEQQLTYPEYDMQPAAGAPLDMSFGQFLAADMGQGYTNEGAGMLYQQQDFDNMMYPQPASGNEAQGGFFFGGGDTSNAGTMSGFGGGFGFGQFGGSDTQTPTSENTGMNFDLFGGSASSQGQGQGQGGFAFSFGGGETGKSGTKFSFF